VQFCVQTYFGSYFVCSSTLDKKSMSHRAVCVAPGDTLDVLEMAWLDSRRVIYLLTLCSLVCRTKCFNAQEVGIIIQWALKLETLYWVATITWAYKRVWCCSLSLLGLELLDAVWLMLILVPYMGKYRIYNA